MSHDSYPVSSVLPAILTKNDTYPERDVCGHYFQYGQNTWYEFQIFNKNKDFCNQLS